VGDAAKPILEVRGLVKDFPGQRALDGVDFDLYPGEVHALLGENGAGKSTLIRCIAGAHEPTSGEILVDGETVHLHTVGDARLQGISVIHQESNLVASQSITDNLGLGAVDRGKNPFMRMGKEHDKARQLLTSVGLDADPRRLVESLRPHEAAMVAMARALHTKARIIILDEPTAALSAVEIEVLFRQIRELATKGVAFVYVSHRLGEVFRLADRITVMREGRRVGRWNTPIGNETLIVDALVGDDSIREAKVPTDFMHDETLLSVDALAVGLGEGVSFSVRKGEVLGLAGLTGAGAEETAAALSGNPPPQSGVVSIGGKVANVNSPLKAKRSGVATVPKDRLRQAILPGFSVRENMSLASIALFTTDRLTHLVNRAPERQAVQRMIDAMHIKTPSTERNISTLSGGNQQKVVIARWLLQDYPVYVFVDPCAGVDIGAKSEIYGLILERARAGSAIVFTSSEAEEYQRVCHRVIVFHEGKVSAELTGDGITETAIVRHAIDPSYSSHTQTQPTSEVAS